MGAGLPTTPKLDEHRRTCRVRAHKQGLEQQHHCGHYGQEEVAVECPVVCPQTFSEDRHETHHATEPLVAMPSKRLQN
jgi:hypothetical protein